MRITSFAAALDFNGVDIEITIAATTEAEAREIIAANFPGEVTILMLLPVVAAEMVQVG